MLRTFRYLAAVAFFVSLLVPPSSPRAFALAAPQTPILVITSAANPFTGYAAEILRAEGLNEFDVQDIDAVAASPGVLSSYDVVVLGQMPLTAAQTSMFVNWVSAGGNLIAMRPDKALYPLLGLSATPGVLSNGYLLFDRSTRPAAGLVGETIQFHGDADIATPSGASTLATLYSDAATSAGAPAVTSISTGAGHAAAFLFDLNRSVVYTRQGNPAWSHDERDGLAPIRSDDLFYGAKAGDVQKDWVDPGKIAIPQADEQQRLLANLILDLNGARKPLPRFWYLPRGGNAAVVMTGDDHGGGGTFARFEQNKSFDPPGCSPANWECVRSTSYVYPGTGMDPALAASYTAQGFEVAAHMWMSGDPAGSADASNVCNDFTAASIAADYAKQTALFASLFPGALPMRTNRTHCVAWSDYATQAQIESTYGIRLDTNYYYWPDSWVRNRPGLFTGSGMPMRFARTDGTLIDVYQAATQMTDEAQQVYPFTANVLLDRALGPEAYYGVFTANMHTDFNANEDGKDSARSSNAIIAAARSRGVPVVSARQLLQWLDGRNGSSFSITGWDGQTLSFTVTAASGSTGLQAMLPVRAGTWKFAGVTSSGNVAVPVTVRTIKGVDYAFFAATSTSYAATYLTDTAPPVITNLDAVASGPDSAVVTWTTDEPATSHVDFGTSAVSLPSTSVDPGYTTSHRVTLTGLSAATTYYYRVTSADASVPAHSATSPAPPAAPSTFVTRPPQFVDTTSADFGAGDRGPSTYVAETTDGEVILKPAIGTEFSTPGLPSDWFVQDWAPSGAATVTQGSVAVDAALIGQNELYEAGRSLEFVATFSDELQHIGFGIDFSTPPWAIFSSDRSQVYARTNNGSASDETPLGSALFGSPHRYRIQWNAGSVAYFVDGQQVASHAVAIAAPMRPLAASDYTPSGGQLVNDWFRMSPYPAAGTFVSRIFAAPNQANQWGALSWIAATPAGTSVAFSVRTGQTPTPDASWTPFRDVPSSGGQAGDVSQYLQYRVTLSTSDPQQTPEVQRVAIEWAAEPPAGGDAGDPTIGSVSAVAGASSAVITWSTNVPATSTVESVGAPSFTAVTDLELTTTHRVTLTGLSGGTTYSYKVTSVAFSGAAVSVPLVPPPLTFTTLPPAFVDTSAGDFNLGANANTSPRSVGDGAIALTSHSVSTPFTGPALPSGWQSVAWQGGGAATVTDGALSVSGARVTSQDSYAPGESIEIVATFSPQSFEHVGLAQDRTLGSGPWALFSTRDTTGSLFARVSTGTASFDVPIPGIAFIGVPHTYRIDWTASGVVFAIDGQVVSSQAAALPAPMYIVASQFPLGDPLTVASVRLPVYGPSGTFISRIFDAGQPQNWERLQWTSEIPDNTALTFQVSTADAPTGPWQTTPGAAIGRASRYIRYEADFATSDSGRTPTLFDVTAIVVGSVLNRAPTANGRSVADNEDTPIAFTVTGSDPDGDSLTFTAVTSPAHGTLTGPGPTFRYTPNPGYAGPDAFTFTVSDGALVSSPATVSITVAHVNHLPLAAADLYSVRQDGSLSSAAPGVLANDRDTDSGDVLRARLVRPPTHGALTLNADGSFVYVPAAGFSGSDSFTYVANDGAADSNVATVTLTITPPSVAPVANDDSYATAEDTALSIAARGVLANDVDPDSPTLAGALVSGPAHGTLTFNLDGSFIYTPALNFNGSDSFTYQASDGSLASNVATVSLTVTAVNDAPAAANDAYTTTEDIALTVPVSTGVLANDTDLDSTTLTATLVSGPAHGTLTLNANGSFTYTPTLNYNGSDSFAYKAGDGSLTSNTATVGLTVTAVNDVPSFTKGGDQSVSSAAGPQAVANWATALSAGPADEASQTLDFVVSVANPALFSVQPAIAGNGTLTYTPAASGGGSTTITARIHDSGGTANGGVDTSAPQTFAITVTPASASTSTTITSHTPASSAYGQAVTLTATVANGSGSGGTPTGSVQFYDNGAALGTPIALTTGSAQLVTTAIGAGTRSLTAAFIPAGAFLASTSAPVSHTVTQAGGTTTLNASNLTPTYSDLETLTAAYTPGVSGGPAPAPASVVFKMGTQVLGAASSVTQSNGVYTYTWTGAMLEPAPFGTGPTGQMKPGSRSASVSITDANFTAATSSKLLTIRAEDARVAYTDPTTFSLGGSATGTVTLRLTAKDITAMLGDPAYDANAGDIRNATVQFWDRTSNVLLGTATVAASGNTATVGTATISWAVNLGTATTKTYSIGFVVANYYTRNSSLDNVSITVNKN